MRCWNCDQFHRNESMKLVVLVRFKLTFQLEMPFCGVASRPFTLGKFIFLKRDLLVKSICLKVYHGPQRTSLLLCTNGFLPKWFSKNLPEVITSYKKTISFFFRKMSPWGEITKNPFGETKRSQVEEKWALTIPELLEASFTKPPVGLLRRVEPTRPVPPSCACGQASCEPGPQQWRSFEVWALISMFGKPGASNRRVLIHEKRVKMLNLLCFSTKSMAFSALSTMIAAYSVWSESQISGFETSLTLFLGLRVYWTAQIWDTRRRCLNQRMPQTFRPFCHFDGLKHTCEMALVSTGCKVSHPKKSQSFADTLEVWHCLASSFPPLLESRQRHAMCLAYCPLWITIS